MSALDEIKRKADAWDFLCKTYGNTRGVHADSAIRYTRARVGLDKRIGRCPHGYEFANLDDGTDSCVGCSAVETSAKCPTCESPEPHRHPIESHCSDKWHALNTKTEQRGMHPNCTPPCPICDPSVNTSVNTGEAK